MVEQAGLAECLPSAYETASVCFPCYSLMANPTLTAFWRQVAEDEALRDKVAYARMYYLNETRMAAMLGLD
jgi:hypothetical protein